MATLKDKVQNALDESRILILGVQIFVGFQFRSVFEPLFGTLPVHAQYLRLGTLSGMVLTLALLIAPAAYHQIVEAGMDTEALHRLTTRVMSWALVPFALALGGDLTIATEQVGGLSWGLLAGGISLLVCGFFWYGWEAWRRLPRTRQTEESEEMTASTPPPQTGGTTITEKIRHVLTEARMILPGAQALLGFQFATILMAGFAALPASSRLLHLLSLALVLLSTILLMTPAAYHRLVEDGEETEHFHRVASRLVLVALVPLAGGISGEVFVVVRKVTDSVDMALTAALLLVCCFAGLWGGWLFVRRPQRR